MPFSPIHIALLTLFLVVGVSISLLQNSLSKANLSLRSALDRLDEAVNRSELAGSVARIGFHEFVAADGRQIWTPEMERLFGNPHMNTSDLQAFCERKTKSKGLRITRDYERAAAQRCGNSSTSF